MRLTLASCECNCTYTSHAAAGICDVGKWTTDLRNNDFVVSFIYADSFEKISASITLNGKSYSTGACLKKKMEKRKKKSERGRKQDLKETTDCATERYTLQSEFLPRHGDVVGTVRIRGLRNFQYGKQSCNLSEWGCLCELWQICVIASSSVPFGGRSSLLIQGMYSYSKNSSLFFICLILFFLFIRFNLLKHNQHVSERKETLSFFFQKQIMIFSQNCICTV